MIFYLHQPFVTMLRTCLNKEDIENRTLEIRSHSAHYSMTLRCGNSLEADAWFEVSGYTPYPPPHFFLALAYF